MLVAVVGFVVTLVLMGAVSFLVQRAWARKETVAPLGDAAGSHKSNTTVLWALILLAIAFTGILRLFHTLTGIAMLDGSIGVALGLYICAHPAANAVNLLFFERDTLDHLSDSAVVRWLALNLIVLLAGWMVVFVALRRLFERPG